MRRTRSGRTCATSATPPRPECRAPRATPSRARSRATARSSRGLSPGRPPPSIRASPASSAGPCPTAPIELVSPARLGAAGRSGPDDPAAGERRTTGERGRPVRRVCRSRRRARRQQLGGHRRSGLPPRPADQGAAARLACHRRERHRCGPLRRRSIHRCRGRAGRVPDLRRLGPGRHEPEHRRLRARPRRRDDDARLPRKRRRRGREQRAGVEPVDQRGWQACRLPIDVELLRGGRRQGPHLRARPGRQHHRARRPRHGRRRRGLERRRRRAAPLGRWTTRRVREPQHEPVARRSLRPVERHLPARPHHERDGRCCRVAPGSPARRPPARRPPRRSAATAPPSRSPPPTSSSPPPPAPGAAPTRWSPGRSRPARTPS